MADDGLGGKFWLAFIGVAIACCFGAVLVALILGNAWARWGFFGMFLFLAVISLAVGWVVDRRSKRRYDSISDTP
jgi:membrane protein implicated in regulation of membrane protease activity